MKVRITKQPSGLLNGKPWPEVDQVIELHAVAGADLCASGYAEPVATKAAGEKRPAAKRAETRKAKG